ncbi:MAG TPA: hypothetical protein VMU50_10240 [Polyangia bacterium]|nr:hypothetical protein [Polyangia bacterium]
MHSGTEASPGMLGALDGGRSPAEAVADPAPAPPSPEALPADPTPAEPEQAPMTVGWQVNPSPQLASF